MASPPTRVTLEDKPRYVKPGAAELALGVERRTLQKWAEEGLIKSLRPGGKGQRLYDVSSVGVRAPEVHPSTKAVDVIYARVSTRKQLPDLQTQIDVLKTKYPTDVVFSDCASGLNFKRRGLASILQLAFERRLRIVHIAHKDRLCRFAYDLIEHVLRVHGATISVEADDVQSAEQELTEDVIAVITVSGARLYGSRSGRARKQKSANSGSTDGASSGGGGSAPEGGAEEKDTIQEGDRTGWAATDIQVEDVGGTAPGGGTEEVLLGGTFHVQLGEQPRKRRRVKKCDNSSHGVEGATTAWVGLSEQYESRFIHTGGRHPATRGRLFLQRSQEKEKSCSPV